MPFSARLYDSPAPATDLPRSRTHMAARMSHSASELHHVVVHNLSPQGVLIESYHPLQIGADIAIDIGGLGEMTGKVIWQDGMFYDCLFDTPASPASVRAKLTSAKVVWANFPSHRKATAESLGHPIAFIPEEAAPAAILDDRLSPRARVGLIVGAASFAWGIPIGIAMLLIR